MIISLAHKECFYQNSTVMDNLTQSCTDTFKVNRLVQNNARKSLCKQHHSDNQRGIFAFWNGPSDKVDKS